MSQAKKNEEDVPESKLQAIKEIIFGENIKEYDYEFKKIRELVQKHREDLESQLAATKKDIEDEIKQMKRDIDHAVSDLQNELSALDEAKTSRQKLGDLLEELGKKLKE